MNKPGTRELTAPHYSTLPRDRERRIVSGTRILDGTLEVCEEIAQGGTAVVYRAIDHRRGGREVALKIITAEANRGETPARFEHEARLGASLAGHPNIVRPLRMGRLDAPAGFEGRVFLLSERVRGVSLDMLMARHPTGLSVARACSIARDIAQALVDLHARGIVHRDIKPGNILIADADGRAKLGDFGLAYSTGGGWERRSPDLTEEGHIPGTPLYMAPEALAHERPTPAFDVFSLGVTLYELLAGDPPYAKLAMSTLITHRCDPERAPYPLGSMCPKLPDSITGLVHRCMAYAPFERPSASEVRAMLDRILATSQPIARSPPKARPRVLVPLATLGVAMLVAGVGWASRDVSGDDLPADARSPTLSAAPYAKVGSPSAPARVEPGVDPRRAAGEAAETTPARTELAPAKVARAETEVSSRALRGARELRRAAGPSEAEPESAADPTGCNEQRQSAHDAAAGERWTQVLRLTKDEHCWDEGHAAERQKLRTWAFLEIRHFKECAAEGLGARDGLVVRWTVICRQRVDAQ